MPAEPRRDLAGLDPAACTAWLAGEVGHSQRFHRALWRQVMAEGRCRPHALPEWQEAEAARPGLLARLGELIAEEQAPPVVARIEAHDPGLGTTTKVLTRLADGRQVESVLIPMGEGSHHTVCVSSQVGCAVGCSFCASGLNGVERDLTAGEIAWQVLHHHRVRPVTNVVFMGSGEPLFNYDNLLRAIRVLADPDGLGLGRRRFTVSTSGVPARIRQLGADEPQVTLALSLHAADDETRSRLVPLNRRWPIEELMAAMDDYAALVNRRITLEYVLLADANMSLEHARSLAAVAARYHAHINLIPFNPVVEAGHRRPDEAAVAAFLAAVEGYGGHATVRGQRGADIDAACGQLKRRVEAEP